MREAHGHSDRRKPCLGRKHLIVVATGTLQITYLARWVAPCGIEDRIELCRIHRGCESVAKRNLLLVVVHVLAYDSGGLGRERTLQSILDVGQVQA